MPLDRTIVRAAIHPAIGIARVGNSPDEFFIGPELPYATNAPAGGYKDAAGALKRQAARFRIYGYNASGALVDELTADDATIIWSVHLANKKAAWYNFEVALDVVSTMPCARRNPAFVGAQRQQLVIDPGPRKIGGRSRHGRAAIFDTGTFCGQPVYLGELHTDRQGRLLVLGGHGHAASAFAHNPPSTYANNTGWYDDTSDGPVEATVQINGRVVPVDPAWVVVAPPNYAPDIISVVSMYDLLVDTFQDQWFAIGATPSFTRDIAPLLIRFCEQQWVNYGFFVQFGSGGPNEFVRSDLMARLASNRAEFAELRRQIFNMFRNPGSPLLDVEGWPPMYGDDVSGVASDPRQLFSVTATQYRDLKSWVAGTFIADWDVRDRSPAQRIEDLPLADQPKTLDQAALTFCLGGPFHPGCELTWPMRLVSMYRAPFRIRPRPDDQPEPDYGDLLTSEIATAAAGPLSSSGPGDLTRWMAVPWHTDTASCQAGYTASYDPFLPTFWPARVPNHVLREHEYQRLIDRSLPVEERLLAFQTRMSWPRSLPPEYLNRIRAMVEQFDRLGVVERRDRPEDLPALPADLYVESEIGFSESPDPQVVSQQQVQVGADQIRRERHGTVNQHIHPRTKR